MTPLSLSTSAVAASITVSGVQHIKCAHCNTPVAELIGGYLVVRSRHHSEKHITVINLLTLASGLKL